jgi:hypothetical protein
VSKPDPQRKSQTFYTEENFPQYETLEKHKIPGLTRERYDKVRRRYIGTAVPPCDPEILYPEEPEKKGLLSWADHQIAEIITYGL